MKNKLYTEHVLYNKMSTKIKKIVLLQCVLLIIY